MTEKKYSGVAINPDAEVLTLKEAASYLRVADITLRKWMERGYAPRYSQVPARGGKILFRKADLLDWLDEHAKEPDKEGWE